MNKEVIVKHNDSWDNDSAPKFTVITPIYNRRKTIQRTINSVENQTYRDFEYILIDDGSTELVDDIIENYMTSTSVPVLFIKKPNGGVHTARNVGIQHARGELLVCIDSDDELTENALNLFNNAWESIPVNTRNQYWQIKALCKYPDGRICSSLFPKDINKMDIKTSRKYFSLASGEQLGCRVTSIMKDNLFPEPDKVKFVNECVVWLEMEKRYRSFGLNEIVRVYHTEGDDRLCLNKNKSIQSCINAYWNSSYELSHPETFPMDYKKYLLTVLRYTIMRQILKKENKTLVKQYKSNNKSVILSAGLLYPFSIVGAIYYRWRYISK